MIMNSVEEKVRKWLEEEHLLKNVIEDHHAFHFAINFPRNSPFSLSVVQPQSKSDLVTIISATQLVPDHFDRIKKASIEKRGQLLRDLRVMLLSRPKVGFQLFFENSRELTLQRYLIILELYEDGLTKTLFMHSLQDVHKAFLLSLEIINSHLGAPSRVVPEKHEDTDKFFAEYL